MIFYADDDQDDLEIFRELSEELEVELATFTDGISLIERLKNPPPQPSLIFLDINMPGYNGLQILEMIRANGDWEKVPVIMFTTSVGEEVIKRSLFLGATYYLPKNPDYEGLKKSIQYVIGHEWKDFLPEEKTFVYQNSSMFDLPPDFQSDKQS
ncbi:response regulator [Flavobacterium sp.]|uniref:response regulator n=1 Tax=Flavobacterium sp. TaxID=239 RepID=UPI00122046FF|nr:response regulator [Flavobacterium sp.]RZJ70308.1 MAG: response regulator [Flavobacterium sp.]